MRFSATPTNLPEDASIKRSQGDGWKITTPQGLIDYRQSDTGVNEVWWVGTNRACRGQGHGQRLVDLMQSAHPSSVIAWGVTTPEGKMLRDSWHAKHPDVEQDNGAFEGQFDETGDNYGGDEDEDEDEDEDDEGGWDEHL